jgi:hypothetical protein
MSSNSLILLNPNPHSEGKIFAKPKIFANIFAQTKFLRKQKFSLKFSQLLISCFREKRKKYLQNFHENIKRKITGTIRIAILFDVEFAKSSQHYGTKLCPDRMMRRPGVTPGLPPRHFLYKWVG